MSEKPNRPALELDPHMRRVVLMIGYMIIVAGFATAFTLLWPVISAVVTVLSPFIVALVVAYLFNPVVNFVERRLRLTRLGGVVLVNVLIILIMGIFIAIIIPILGTQIGSAYVGTKKFIMDDAVPWVEQRLVDAGVAEKVSFDELRRIASEWLGERKLTLEEAVRKLLGNAEVRSAATEAAAGGADVVGKILLGILAFLKALFSSFMFLVFVGLVSFYLLLDFAALRGVTEVVCPDHYEERLFDILAKIDVAVGGFIRGQVISAVLVGLLTFIGLTILGLKQYALLIACIAGVGNLIPYLGPVMGATPAVLYMLTTKDVMQAKLLHSAMVIGLFGFIQFIDGFVFQPKIVGKAAQLHPVVVIVALALGAQFGIIGMIIAVPAACVGRVLMKEFFWDRRHSVWEQTTGKTDLADHKPGRKSVDAVKKLEQDSQDATSGGSDDPSAPS